MNISTIIDNLVSIAVALRGAANMKIAKVFLLIAFVPSVALADYEEDKKKYDECVAKVKREYVLAPASINALRQLVISLCGQAPKPPAPAKK